MTRQRIARRLAAPLAAAVVAAGIGLAPATATEPHTAQPAAAVAAHDAAQDGKDLFRAVFFFQGEMADELMREGILTAPAQALEWNQSEEGRAMIDDLMQLIQEHDPTFFATFSGQLRSGDPFQVEAGFQRANDLLGELAPTVTGGDHSAAIFAFMVAVAVVVVAVYAATWGGLTHHAVALNKRAVADSTLPRGGRDLDHERQIADLTGALATVGTGGRA